MSVREVNFVRDVVYGIAHLLDIDTEEDFLKDQARSFVSAINDKVREGLRAFDWPELELTEERPFRQVWHSGVTYFAEQGDASEVYHVATETYYRAEGDPDAGVEPQDDPDRWTPIALGALDRFIAYHQYGKQAIDRVIGIYPRDPRTSHCRPLASATCASGRGVDVFGCCSGNTVWVTYIPRPPEFSTYTYSTAKTYKRGDIVLDLETGDCYRALLSSTNQPLALATYWRRQVFPYVIAPFVKYDAAADLVGDAAARADFRTQAQKKLQQEIVNILDHQPRARYRLFPRRRRCEASYVCLPVVTS